ncbi:hypothetical protein BD779DRAFT_1583644 [Infundibulicybe gibba]|nr:hypothetical protein BD779DRAFT_1583644 [Infundibulicybe gibba]
MWSWVAGTWVGGGWLGGVQIFRCASGVACASAAFPGTPASSIKSCKSRRLRTSACITGAHDWGLGSGRTGSGRGRAVDHRRGRRYGVTAGPRCPIRHC